VSLSENSRTVTAFAHGGGVVGAGQQRWIGAKVIAVVAGFLVANPIGLCFRALVMFAGVVELAIAAGMQVRAAPGARVAPVDAASSGILNLLAALPAVEEHISLSAFPRDNLRLAV